MDKFKQLSSEINILLEKNASDKEKVDKISSVIKYSTEMQKYYNSIPDAIRTENTLDRIINDIKNRIDQITRVPVVYVVVERDCIPDTTDDTIDMAFLKQQSDQALNEKTAELQNQRAKFAADLKQKDTELQDQQTKFTSVLQKKILN